MKRFIAFPNDKGGVGKSHTGSIVFDWLTAKGQNPRLVEVEQRMDFSQELVWRGKYRYRQEASDDENRNAVVAITLAEVEKGLLNPSLHPLEALQVVAQGNRPLVVDCGASVWALLSEWLITRGQAETLKALGYEFTFMVPVLANDVEAARFYANNYAELSGLGEVVLVRNERDGSNYFPISPELVKREISMPAAIYDLRESLLSADGYRRTLREIADDPSVSRRAQLDAEEALSAIEAQFEKHADILLSNP